LAVKDVIEVFVSCRLRATGRVFGCPITLPAGTDLHDVRTSDVAACLADFASVAPEEIEVLDMWAETFG
jgi:hypothetical protein